MLSGVWGKKIGMTQVFDGEVVVPVTAIDVNNWVVINSKTVERDGYNAVVVGCIKKRYLEQAFSSDWTKKQKLYFSFVREIKVKNIPEDLEIGKKADFHAELNEGDTVDVFGITKGCGFAGVVRRHNFAGGPASHGSTMGKRTGSLGGSCTQGKVIKGKAMPGHMGVRKRAAQGLRVVKKVDTPNPIMLVKGSIPGKAGSLVFIRKA